MCRMAKATLAFFPGGWSADSQYKPEAATFLSASLGRRQDQKV